MYIDADLSLCAVVDNVMTAQAETTAASYISDNVLDLTHIPRNIINNLFWVFQIEDAITGTSETFAIQLVTSAAVGLGTNQILFNSGTLNETTIEAWAANSTVFVIKISPYLQHRYIGCTYVIGGAAFATGSWRSFLTPDAPFLIAATP